MSETTTTVENTSAQPARKRRGRWVWLIIIAVLALIVVLGTRVVSNDDPLAGGDSGAFNAETFGAENFPEIQSGVEESAVDGVELAEAIAADADAAASEYAVESSGGPVFSVTFTGVAGEGASGIYPITIEGMPAEPELVRVQFGPAINGTELRDATGEIQFGDFSNQIDFQNAAAAVNDQLKAEVLDGIDAESLEGKTVTVTGAFTLINPATWLVTPVSVEVQ